MARERNPPTSRAGSPRSNGRAPPSVCSTGTAAAADLPPELAPLRPGSRLGGAGVARLRPDPHPGHDYDASIRLGLGVWDRSRPGRSPCPRPTRPLHPRTFGELSANSGLARLRGSGDRRGTPRRGVHPARGLPRSFSRYVTPQDCVPRWEILARGDGRDAVALQARLGRDWIVGDRDGVVVVPAGWSRRCPRRAAEAKVATEDEIREAVRSGTLPLRRLRALRHLLSHPDGAAGLHAPDGALPSGARTATSSRARPSRRGPIPAEAGTSPYCSAGE